MLKIDRKKLFSIITDDEIISPSSEVFQSLIGCFPVRIDQKTSDTLEKFANIEVDGINPNDRIVGKLLSYNEAYVLCVIVLHSRSIEIPKTTKFSLNFYKILNVFENKIAERYEQVIIYSGDGACIAGQGSTEEIGELERTLYQQTSGDGAQGETWFGRNIFYFQVITPPVLCLVVGWIVLKK